MSMEFEPIENVEAARAIASKTAVGREVFDRLLPELRARAFVVTGLEDLRMVAAVRDEIAKLPAGESWETVSKKVREALEAGGFSEEAAAQRAELLVRHHGFQAYAQADWAAKMETKDALPYWKYQTMGDGHVRDSHAALDGLVLPADDPFWEDHYPPWEWGCRCQVVAIDEEEYQELVGAGRVAGQKGFDGSEEQRAQGWTLGPAGRKALREGRLDDGTGRPVNVARPKEESYHWHPREGGIGVDLSELEKKYGAEDFGKFREQMKKCDLGDGRTAWDWLEGTKAPGGAGGQPAPRQGGRKPPEKTAENAPAGAVAEARTRLEKMEVAEVLPNPKRGANESRILVGKNGERAVFKPAEGERKLQLRAGVKPGTQHRREAAASIVDEELGTGLVPATALRTVDGETGSVQEMVKIDNTVPAKEMSAVLQGEAGERLYLLDEVLGSLDRKGNLAFARSADGKLRLVAIDNGLSLPTETVFGPTAAKGFEGTSRGRFRNKEISAPLVESLQRFLEREETIREKLGELLGDEAKEALDGMFGRVRVLLRGKHYLKAGFV